MRVNPSQRLPQHSELTPRNIMSAILQSRSPVSTHATIRQSWKFLRKLSAADFEKAALDLQESGFGTYWKESAGGKLRRGAFIKKMPEEVVEVLGSNQDLCSQELYSAEFKQSPSKSIDVRLRAKLVDSRLVTKDMMV